MGVCSLPIEEMKVVSRSMLELLQQKEVAETVLMYDGETTVGKLLVQYGEANNCNHVGEVLRMFAKSDKLVGCLLTTEALDRLVELNLNEEFQVQSDS